MPALDNSTIRRPLFPLRKQHREPPAATYSSGNVGWIGIHKARICQMNVCARVSDVGLLQQQRRASRHGAIYTESRPNQSHRSGLLCNESVLNQSHLKADLPTPPVLRPGLRLLAMSSEMARTSFVQCGHLYYSFLVAK